MVKWLTLSVVICTYTTITFQNVQSKENLSQECLEDPLGWTIFTGGYRHRMGMIIENNTATSCLARCKTLQRGIAGAKNKHCYCGDHANSGNRGRCNTRCPGDKAEICGGLNSISILFTSASQPHGYVGCYPENSMVLILGPRHALNSGKYCIRLCMSRNYRYAGTKTIDCKCSNSRIMADNTEAACTVRCPGNFEEICGSNNSLSLYDTSLMSATTTTTTTSKVTAQTTRISQKTIKLLQPKQSDNTISTSTRTGKVSQPHGYIGCYPYNTNVLIHGQRDGRNSGIFCINLCMSRSYRYAGTMIYECRCSNIRITGENTEAACTFPCPGNYEEICGGSNRISLYDTSMMNITNKTTTTATTASSSKSRTTEKQRPKWSKISQKMSSASYRTEAGSTDVLTTASFTYINDKTEANSTSTSSVAADTDSDTTTAMTAIYISLPVVVIANSVTVLVICFILRRKWLKNEPRVKYNRNPSGNRFQNADNGTDLESSNYLQDNSNACNFIPSTSQYEQDTAESRKSDDNISANCSTTFIDPRKSMASNHQYVNIKIQPADSTNTNAIYSDLQVTQDTKEHIYNELLGTS